jgi:hypothetical protein
MANGGKYIVDIIPALKGVSSLSKNVANGVYGGVKFGLKKGGHLVKEFGKTFKNSVGFSMGSMLTSAIQGSLDRVKEFANQSHEILQGDDATSRIAKRYGVEQGNLDALQKYAGSQGVDKTTVLQSFVEFAKKLQTGEINVMGGKNALDKYMLVMDKISKMDQRRKDYFTQTYLGGGMENLVDPNSDQRNAIMREIYKKGFNLKERNSQIGAGKTAYDKEMTEKQRQELERQQTIEKAAVGQPNTLQAAILNESQQQTDLLKDITKNIQDSLDNVKTIQEGQKLIREGVNVIMKGVNTIVQFMKDLVKHPGSTIWKMIKGGK